MNQKTKSIIGLVLKITVCVLAIVCGALFMMQALRIYALGSNPYNAEIVGEYFSEIAVPVWLFLALVLLSGAFFSVYPESSKTVGYSDGKKTLALLKNRLPLSDESYAKTYEKSVSSLQNRKTYRVAAWLAVALVCAVSAVVMIVYLSNAEHFTGEHVTDEVKAMVFAFLPYLIASFAAFLVALGFETWSLKKEIAQVKELFKESVKDGVKPVQRPQEKGKIARVVEKIEKAVFTGKGLTILRSVIAVGCVVLVIVGIANGGFEDVLGKAKRICQECIGLG